MIWRDNLVRESEWMRIYESDRWGRVHESKFLTDCIQVSAESIFTRWGDLSFEEKLEFANAFAVKPEVTLEDERILNFLMELGEPHIGATIASILPRHTDRDRVLSFLLSRLHQETEMKANYYQALELLKDTRSVPSLREDFEAFQKRLQNAGKLEKDDDYLDFLSCCKALWVIEGTSVYKEAIEQHAKSEQANVKAWAETLLKE